MLVAFGLALGCQPAPAKKPLPQRSPSLSAALGKGGALRPQPKPGERVRQPELDSYCVGAERPSAFYYHGGSPVVTLARKDGCAPLFITECEGEGRCYPPRDQEPGMWCCATDRVQQPTAQGPVSRSLR